MVPAFIVFLFWFLSIVLETTVFSISNWFQPSLHFLAVVIFCLHWRGSEVYYISTLFGLTADCFSTLPFGIFGVTYFVLSFPMRWYAIKIYQEAFITLPLVVGAFTLIMDAVVLILLKTFFSFGEFSNWLSRVIFNEVIPTAILAIPCLMYLIYLEKRYRIHLSERKF